MTNTGNTMTSQNQKLSTRATKAIEILKAGGYFRKALETQYRGGEKFTTRLRYHNGQVAKGFGFQTEAELSKAGWLQRKDCAQSSTWPTESELVSPNTYTATIW